MHSNFFFSTTDNSDCNFLPLCSKEKLSESLAFSNHMHVVNCEKQCKQVDNKSKFDKATYRIMFHNDHKKPFKSVGGQRKNNHLQHLLNMLI